jgi:FkbM family methyltransferase
MHTMKTPTAELPGLGWTERVHPKFGEYPIDHIARVALRRLTPRYRHHRQLTAHDGPAAIAMAQAIEKAADKPSFTVMQVGAHDGNFDDPLQKYIEKYNWRAVLVEPRQAPFTRLAERYEGNPNIKLVNAAVSRTAGSMTLWSAAMDGPGYKFGEAIASTNPEQVKREIERNLGKRALRNISIIPENVSVLTVADICDETGTDPSDINFFLSDTEGHDTQVVASLFDTLESAPQLLQYEHFHVETHDAMRLDTQLIGLGMSLVKTHKDTMAIPSIPLEAPALELVS